MSGDRQGIPAMLIGARGASSIVLTGMAYGDLRILRYLSFHFSFTWSVPYSK